MSSYRIKLMVINICLGGCKRWFVRNDVSKTLFLSRTSSPSAPSPSSFHSRTPICSSRCSSYHMRYDYSHKYRAWVPSFSSASQQHLLGLRRSCLPQTGGAVTGALEDVLFISSDLLVVTMFVPVLRYIASHTITYRFSAS
jgi:hypothetical protein